jgi:antitoxin FitA
MIVLTREGWRMASITIRNLDEALKRKLRVRAAHRNRSMEDKVRDILRTVLAQDSPSTENLAAGRRRNFPAATRTNA